MLLIKKLKDSGFDLNQLPVDIKKGIDLISNYTDGSFDTDSQKIEVLDSSIFDSIQALHPEDKKVKRVAYERAFEFSEIENDSFNTNLSEEGVVEHEIEVKGSGGDVGGDEIDAILSRTTGMASGGEAGDMSPKFINYKGKEIMYEPISEEYFVGDEVDGQFKSLGDAKKYIDKGAPMSAKTINAYRHGAMASGGVANSGINWIVTGTHI